MPHHEVALDRHGSPKRLARGKKPAESVFDLSEQGERCVALGMVAAELPESMDGSFEIGAIADGESCVQSACEIGLAPRPMNVERERGRGRSSGA